MSEGYVPGKEKCKRCGRWFTPKVDEKYGPTCARKIAGQHTLPDGTIEVYDLQGNRTAVIV